MVANYPVDATNVVDAVEGAVTRDGTVPISIDVRVDAREAEQRQEGVRVNRLWRDPRRPRGGVVEEAHRPSDDEQRVREHECPELDAVKGDKEEHQLNIKITDKLNGEDELGSQGVASPTPIDGAICLHRLQPQPCSALLRALRRRASAELPRGAVPGSGRK